MKTAVTFARVVGVVVLIASLWPIPIFAKCVDNSQNPALRDAYEPDDIPQQADTLSLVPISNALSTPQCQSHSIAPAGDQDWFVFQAIASYSYEVRVINYSSTLAPRVTLVGQDGVTIIYPSVTTDACDSGLPIVCFDFNLHNWGFGNGSYFLVVDDPDPGATGNYDIFLAAPNLGTSINIVGTVEDQAGNPIGGANVVALVSPNTIVATGGVSKAHQYSLAAPNPSIVQIIATASGYTQLSPPTLNLSDSLPNPYTANLTMKTNATVSPPTPTALSATGTGQASASLRGSVLTNGASTSVSFSTRQGTGDTWTAVPGSQQTLSQSSAAVAVSATVTGLACGGTAYEFEVNASNSAGLVSSTPISFATESCSAPSVNAMATAQPAPPATCSTGSCAADLSATGASSASETDVELQFRLADAAFWNTVGPTPFSSSTFNDSHAQSGLQCGASYQLQALARDQGANSWVYSTLVAFSTGACAVSGVKLQGALSGNWFDPSPNQSGHGFQLEFTGQANTVLAIWFVYPPNGGGQNWIYAQGTFDSTKNSVTIPAILLTGPKFPPLYNSHDLQQTNWGTITFSFSDCNNGTAIWNSTVAGYGSGTIPIQRLTSIQGTTCLQ